jgi:hypothetical protein
MLFATGHRDLWNEWDLSAASRLSSGTPRSV